MRLWKKMIPLVVLALVLCIAALTPKAQAAESGTCGDNLTWQLDSSGTLTVSGTGPMTNFMNDDVTPWRQVRDSIQHIVIGEGVTTVGDWAFTNCANLQTVVLGDDVTTVCFAAFDECHNLRKVTLGKSVANIGTFSFHASALTHLTLPDSIKVIGNAAFYCCSKLNYVKVPEGATTIEEFAFAESGLTSVNISSTVTRVEKLAFYDCPNLKAIWVDPANQNYSNDKDGVFFNKNKTFLIQAPCAISGNYTIPQSVQTIGELSFYNCQSLQGVEIPEGATTIDNGAFSWCVNLQSVSIPASVSYIHHTSFASCASLDGIWVDKNNPYYSSDSAGVLFDKYKTTLIKAPGGIKGRYALPASVTTIGHSAFHRCFDLVSVSVGLGVTTIEESAFEACDLLYVYYAGDQTQWDAIEIGERNWGLDGVSFFFNHAHEFADGMCICGALEAEQTPALIAGDVNLDGEVNNDDVIILMWHVLFPADNPVQVPVDFNKDSQVDNNDVIYLMWHVLFPEDNPL